MRGILQELFSSDFNLQKFYQIVTQDFHRDGGDVCVDSVKKLWNIVKTYGETGNEIIYNLKRQNHPKIFQKLFLVVPGPILALSLSRNVTLLRDRESKAKATLSSLLQLVDEKH